MNANELISQVIGIVHAPDYDNPADILKLINGSNRRIADLVLLPDLMDGFDTVDTATGEMEADLPPTYHRNLFMARVAGKDIDIFQDVVSMSMIRGGLSLDAGDVAAVAVKKGALVYQKVPAASVEIELRFYRLPIPMVIVDEEAEGYDPEQDQSLPDGAYGNDDFDWAIIHDTCAKIFNIIESDINVVKVNTISHTALLKEKIDLLRDFAEAHGVQRPKRPSTNLSWLGVR